MHLFSRSYGKLQVIRGLEVLSRRLGTNCCSHIMILKCDVRPSYRTTSPNHKPWIFLDLLGNVVTAHCNCMAGLGETCSHVVAMLYKIEAAVRIGMTSPTPTDLPCQWNQTFIKNIVGFPVSSINLYSDSAKEKLKRKKNEENACFPNQY
ncbi:uncharacterized protein LOC136080930 [Hydra vulgaris]|uniref:Uncharacterized protein LOC136080930 n=1 Tax=Hydra vulgaris TaxID=6087 RepID=A0ABM4BYQ6_HYDVU